MTAKPLGPHPRDGIITVHLSKSDTLPVGRSHHRPISCERRIVRTPHPLAKLYLTFFIFFHYSGHRCPFSLIYNFPLIYYTACKNLLISPGFFCCTFPTAKASITIKAILTLRSIFSSPRIVCCSKPNIVSILAFTRSIAVLFP